MSSSAILVSCTSRAACMVAIETIPCHTTVRWLTRDNNTYTYIHTTKGLLRMFLQDLVARALSQGFEFCSLIDSQPDALATRSTEFWKLCQQIKMVHVLPPMLPVYHQCVTTSVLPPMCYDQCVTNLLLPMCYYQCVTTNVLPPMCYYQCAPTNVLVMCSHQCVTTNVLPMCYHQCVTTNVLPPMGYHQCVPTQWVLGQWL